MKWNVIIKKYEKYAKDYNGTLDDSCPISSEKDYEENDSDDTADA